MIWLRAISLAIYEDNAPVTSNVAHAAELEPVGVLVND